jgi:hypothetical protein
MKGGYIITKGGLNSDATATSVPGRVCRRRCTGSRLSPNRYQREFSRLYGHALDADRYLEESLK